MDDEMKYISVRLSIGYPGAERTDEIEVPKDASEDEIYEIVREWAMEYVDYSYKEIKE